jgi:PAS domain S-box-containing protein
MTALLVALLALLNSALGVQEFYGLDLWSKMALHEAFCFVALSTGILFAYPETGVVEVLTGESRGGYMNRRLLIAAIIVPSVIGWLCLVGQRAGYYDIRKGISLLIVANIFLIFLVIWLNAESLRDQDSQHLKGDAKLRETITGLEKQLREQTAEAIRANKDLWAEIQERARLEEELAATEEYLKDFYEGAPEDIYENIPIGVHKVGPDGLIMWANRTELELLGYSREDYVGRHISELHADQQLIEDLFDRLWRGEKIDGVEARLLARDGSTRNVLISSDALCEDDQPAFVRCFTRDLTAHKQTESALSESEEFNRRLFACSADCIEVLDSEGQLISMNAQCMKLMEIDDVGPYVGKPWADLWEGDAGDAAREALEIARAGGVGHFNRYCRTINGKPRWWDVAISPMLNGDGKPERLIATSRDVTVNKETEEERDQLLMREQAARELAEDASRLRDEFFANISHELRAPLNAILGWVKLLRTNRLSSDECARALETVERSAQQHSRVINDLLDVSRMITGKQRLNLAPVKPASLIEVTVENMLPAAEAKAIRLETSIDYNAGPISCDPDRLQQIVWNLLSNAIKYTPKGGRVQIRLERVHSNVDIIVSDTGMGIHQEFLPFVFDRFRQSNGSNSQQHRGLGLGLSIVRHLTEMHGGTVRAESAGAGRGSTFIVRLPLIISQVYALNEAREVQTVRDDNSFFESSGQFSGLQVLVVDSDSNSHELIKNILGQYGADVAVTSSTNEALAIITSLNGSQTDLLIYDTETAGDGDDSLIQKLRQLEIDQGRTIPAIALTTHVSAEDRLRALSTGLQIYVSKPIESVELLTVVASLTGRLDLKMDFHVNHHGSSL